MMKGLGNKVLATLGAILCVAAIAGCEQPANDDPTPGDSGTPTITMVSPLDAAIDVAADSLVTVTFSEAMDEASITTTSFIITEGYTAVDGALSFNENTVTFTPTHVLMTGNVYTATVTTVVTDAAGNALASDYVWSFTAVAVIPFAVDLGTAANYVVLAETGIADSGASAVTGDLACSPYATSFITGFALVDATGFATSAKVTGRVYAADMADPTPINLTTATADKRAAYTSIATLAPAVGENLNRPSIGGTTFAPGLYSWGANLPIDSSITLEGGTNDVWIFQITGNLAVAAGVQVILAGNAQAENVYWQITGGASFLAGAEFVGNVMTEEDIAFESDTAMNGRLMSWTAVTLNSTTVVME